VQVAGDARHADGRGQRRRAPAVGVVAADEQHVLAGRGEPGQLGPEAGAQGGDADGAGDVRLVELQLGADVDEQRALGPPALELARGERVRLGAVLQQRAAVDVDDVAEVRRLRPERRERGVDERVLVLDRERRVVRALEPDRRRHLEVHPRAAAHRSTEVPGPQLDLRGEREQAPVERAVDAPRSLLLLDREVRPRHVAHEQAVAG
jgi:hypothetical protein